MSRIASCSVVGFSFLLAACTTPPPPLPQPIPTTAPAPAPAPGAISHADLNATIDRGLGYFLQRVSVRRVLDRGAFAGWQVLRFDGTALRPGDVIRAVNGSRVETPDEALRVFQAARAADAIVVDVVRDGQAITLRFPVVDRSGTLRP